MRGGRTRRERLVSGGGIVLSGAAFLVAFALLVPSREAFTVGTDASGAADRSLDDLTLAYLGARAAKGSLGHEEAFASLVSLAGEGRLAEAHALLAASTAIAFSPSERARLDLELAAGGVHRAPEREAERARLAAVLERLLSRPELHATALLERAAGLSALAGEARIGAAFERRLAAIDPDRAALWYARCGRRLAAAGSVAAAIDCLERARLEGGVASARFEVGLELLALLPDGPAGRRDALAEALLDEASGPEALESLARTLLALERPRTAARAYARLAMRAKGEERARWLADAARWSEAAGRPAEAAVFLDAMTPHLELASRPAHGRRIEALLIGAGRSRDALERIAARVASEPHEAVTVREAVAAARRVGEEGRALGWNTAYLLAHGDDAEAIDRQVALALALGRADLARLWAERALALAPDSRRHLVTLARLAEWDGEPEAALRWYRRLGGERADAETLREIARLAELVWQPGVAARALEELARLEPPDQDEVERLVRLHELDGRSDRAAAALEAIMVRHGPRARTLMTLAALHERHVRHAEALDARERLAARFGRSAEETLARVELLWRLGRRAEAAELAADLESLSFAATASDYQVSLLAEIGWRYRQPALSALVRPRLLALESEERQLRYGRRSVRTAMAAGDAVAARREAENLWRVSGEPELGLLALRLAVESDDRAMRDRLFDDEVLGERLRGESGYWSLRATVALREDEPDVARRAWERALVVSPDDAEALGGLIWLHVGESDEAALAAALERALPLAPARPSLWTAMAVGHLRIGEAAASLPWFERALDEPNADYGLWLTYADALEGAGDVDRARQVRRHALAELRPRIREDALDDRDAPLREYGQVLARYGGAEDREAWMRHALTSAPGGGSGPAEVDAATRAWREDMSISWLMSTERHEHARLIMTRLHGARLATPPWQALALALHDEDVASVAAVIESSGGALSVGDRVLALRRVGRESEAWALARTTLRSGAVPEPERRRVREQYAAMRRLRANDFTARLATRSSEGLDVQQLGFALRRPLGTSGLGAGLDVSRERLAASRLDIGVGKRSEVRTALEASVFRAGERGGFGLSAGILDDGDEDLVYGTARLSRRDRSARRELALELGWREPVDGSPELEIAARRSRAALSVESVLGRGAFTRFGAELGEIETRVSERRLARGLTTRAELGRRGTVGRIAWSGSVLAEDVRNERASTLPDALRLAPDTTLDALVPRRASTLSLNASLSSGAPIGASAARSTPGLRLGGRVSHAWPERAYGLRIGGGAGIRVLGNDELALVFTREATLSGTRSRADATTFGLSYQRYF